jgi:parvulin-like peptidyl-prolyl isomerase
VGAKQVLIAYKGASGAPETVTRTKEQAKARADEALAKLRSGSSSFEELVKAYSDDPMAPRTGGAIGNFERNAMPASYSDAAFRLELGAVSDVVETPRGYFLIKRVY